MKQDDELWMKKKKEMLKDYDERVPLGSWEKLEKSLSPVAVERRIPAYRWWVAAAVMLLAVSGISFYFLNTPVADDIRLASETVVEITPDIIPPIPDSESAYKEPVKEMSIKQALHIAKATITPTPTKEVEEGINDIETIEATETAEKETSIVSEPTDTDVNQQDDIEKKEKTIIRPSSKDKLHLPIENKKKSSDNRKLSFGLSINSGASVSMDSQDYVDLPQSMSSIMPDLANSDGFLELNDRQSLYFKEGVPYIQPSVELSHRQPITLGLSVRKGLNNGFSVETGLSYTLLSSDIHNVSGSEKKKTGTQELHYIGIPLRANWNFINSKNFTLYLTAGGMVEKCVYGKSGSEKNTVKPLQFSLAGGIGAQYNITKQLGIYAEPGVAYFFDDGSGVETIRKENPFNINLQAGIRFTY